MIRRIGFPWSPAMVERSRRSAGATIAAARAALEDGASVNLAGGTHHAFADRGEGYCVFNDVAVAARVLQREGRCTRLAVVDCDVHQGNGTAAIFQARSDGVHLLDARREELPVPQGDERSRRRAARRRDRRRVPRGAGRAPAGGVRSAAARTSSSTWRGPTPTRATASAACGSRSPAWPRATPSSSTPAAPPACRSRSS